VAVWSGCLEWRCRTACCGEVAPVLQQWVVDPARSVQHATLFIMLRRTFAAIVLGPALFAASLAWAGFGAQRTVFDPNRSEQVATDLYDDAEVRSQLTSNLASALNAALPEEITASPSQLDAAASRILDDEAVRTIVVGTFVQSHRAFLGDGDLPQQVDFGSAGESVRSALVAIRPDLDASLPAAPALMVDLPTERVPNASPIRAFLDRAVPILAAIALVGVAVALFATSARQVVLRRAGWWAITSAAAILVIGLGLPYLLRMLLPGQSAVFAAIMEALLRSLVGPAALLAAAGAALLGASFVVTAKASAGPLKPTQQRVEGRVTGRIDIEPAAQQPRKATEQDYPNWAPRSEPISEQPRPATPTPNQSPTASGSADVPSGTRFIDSNATSPHLTPISVPVAGQPTALIGLDPGRTQIIRLAEPAITKPQRAPRKSGEPEPPSPKWREGIGWVQHPDDHRDHPGTRWEPGIGYILPGPIDE
jgi:hypothetical protein